MVTVEPDPAAEPVHAYIAAAVAVRVAAVRAALEEACEAALQTGDRGVLVRTEAGGLPVAAAPDERVPYGQLWYVPEGVDLP